MIPQVLYLASTSPNVWSLERTEKRRASNSSLSASMSTASCSSPKEFTHEVAVHDAVRTCAAGPATACQSASHSLTRGCHATRR